MLNAASLFLILFSVTIIVLGVVKIHEYPSRVAEARNHPQQHHAHFWVDCQQIDGCDHRKDAAKNHPSGSPFGLGHYSHADPYQSIHKKCRDHHYC